jgi:tetratricopeptide (TPR) repeat protein
MGVEAALQQADSLVLATTGKHLNDLQRQILQAVWQRQTYGEIAQALRYTEGHIKDTASQLWQTLSQALDERVTKGNSLTVLERYLEVDRPNMLLQAGAPQLLGRQGEIAQLDHLVAQGHRAIVLQGEGGIGKTTLAQHYLERQPLDLVLELLMAKETADLTPAEQVAEEWLRQDFQTEPGQDFGVTLDRLKRQLRERRVGILIDNLEPALNAHGRFWQQHNRYGDLLRVLCHAKGATLVLLTSRDRLCEPGIPVTHYRLPGLSLDTWHRFFEQQGICLTAPQLAAMHRAYGGNAKAMHILSSVISDDFEGDGDAYWQVMGNDPLTVLDLKNLVTAQVARLRLLDPAAYQLLCRLSAFRYQDVPRVPIAGLFALLWDVDPACHRQVITALRNRSLLESYKGTYWLHPVVQADSRQHLRQSPDWVKTHTAVSHFWTRQVPQITTLTEAIQALEAYYPEIAIGDYDAAAEVLLRSRPNQWGQHLTLGSTLYRMGLLQPVITAIPPLLPHLPEDQRTSELRNILADTYWIAGKTHTAISLQKQALAISQQGFAIATTTGTDAHTLYCWRMLEVDALLSLGLYHLDLWELETAAHLFQQVISTAEGTPHQSWADKASLCLTMVAASYPTHPPHTHAADREIFNQMAPSALADKAYMAIADAAQPEYSGRFAFFLQLLGQTYTYLNQPTRATELFQRAITAAEESHYIQVKGKALVGWGSLFRQLGCPDQALQHMYSALHLLEELGAKGDLAEAHYQLGLTHLTQDQRAIAQTHFTTAIRYFEDIQAPRQVTKVQAVLPL